MIDSNLPRCMMRCMSERQAADLVPRLDDLSRAQQDRLKFIDFTAYFLGKLRRSDVMDRFGTGPAAATRDITLYRELVPTNLAFDGIGKVYKPSPEFVPLFVHSPQRVLTALSQGFGDGGGEHLVSLLPCEYPIPLSLPEMSVLAPVTRAINLKKPLRVSYHSVTSGGGVREIVPLALVNSGARWHVRAFDRKRGKFLDFVPTRMENPVVLEDSPVKREETAELDVQWSRIMELDLVVHPDHKMPEVVVRDYRMKDGVLRATVRAALAGYMLRLWAVDCSPDHSEPWYEHALWLRDPLALYGSDSAKLAPGYVNPVASRSADPD